MDDHNNYETFATAPIDVFWLVHQTLVDGCAALEQQNNRDVEAMARLLSVTDAWLERLKKPLVSDEPTVLTANDIDRVMIDEKLRYDQAIRDLIYNSAVHSDPAGGYIDLPDWCVPVHMPYTPPEETPAERYARLAQSHGRLLNDAWVVNLKSTYSVSEYGYYGDILDRINYYGGFSAPALKNRLLDRLKCRLRHHLEKRLDHLLWLVESERVGKHHTKSTPDGMIRFRRFPIMNAPDVNA